MSIHNKTCFRAQSPEKDLKMGMLIGFGMSTRSWLLALPPAGRYGPAKMRVSRSANWVFPDQYQKIRITRHANCKDKDFGGSHQTMVVSGFAEYLFREHPIVFNMFGSDHIMNLTYGVSKSEKQILKPSLQILCTP